ncbi:hypothetical protein AB0A94_02365 [Streptomyces sp. NPDC044984]|uniref:hypothetical protein n=1 Tax=Streptomyces sp. NPDC044984 TaxID=3154335 RepID=UPI00340DF063
MDVCDGDYIKADNEWDELRWLRERTDAPKGCRVEIVEGLVTVTPLARVRHHIIAAQVHRRLHEAIPEDWGAHQWWDIAVPERLGLYVPDLVVVRENTGARVTAACALRRQPNSSWRSPRRPPRAVTGR